MPTLTFKVSPEEARAIRARARQEKISLSAFLRSQLLEKKTRRRIVLKRHPVSGVLMDASPGAKVTQAQIDAALADFP
jgi:hypothetical protein